MWRIRLSDRDLQMVQEVTERRQDKKRRHAVRTQKYDVLHNDFEIAYYGFLGEVAVARLLCIEPDKTVLIGGDGGTDLTFAGRRLQIKTPISAQTKDWLYFNDESRFTCEYGILCNLDEYKTSVTVRGIIGQKEFIKKCVTIDFGYGERIAVPAKQLLSVDGLIRAAQQQHFIQVGDPC